MSAGGAASAPFAPSWRRGVAARALLRASILFLLTATLAPRVEAAVRRFALLVANNEGSSTNAPLYFAEDDAEKVARVLTLLGGYAEEDISVLLGANRSDVLLEMGLLRDEIYAARSRGDEVVFLFYYSGHADDEQLLLGRSWLTWDELERMLDNSGAQIRLALVDACQSGALTRSKGGTRAPSFVFDVSERLNTEGSVLITSSAGDEASQESDEIGGSYFTHYLVSGLYGAADLNSDQIVTLAEAYAYVYDETVLRTWGTRSGTQHPTYEWDLAGEADVVLTELDTDRASLIFGAELAGTYAIFDIERRAFVAEVDAGGVDRRLAVRPGNYLVQRRFPTHLLVAETDVQTGQTLEVAALEFAPVEYEDDVAKGALDKQIRQAQMPKSSLRLLVGAASPDGEVSGSYLLAGVPMAGAAWRLEWRDGRWLGADLVAGGRGGDLQIPDVGAVPVTVSMTNAGFNAGFATRPGSWRAGGGLRLGGTWTTRSFEDSQQLDDQYLLSLTPGLLGWVGWHPGRFQMDLELRSMWVPYQMDERARGFRMSELMFGVGYRF